MVVKPNAKIKITEYGTDKLILDTMYYIEFPEGIPKYKGSVGYQGGLNQEQYFIPNSWKYGEIIETYPYGSWYTKVPKNSEVQARIDLAIKKWWVDSNGEIKIRGFEADKSILDTMYYIEFPEGISKYKGPVGYQGGLNQEQYFIPNSWKYEEIIETYPIK